jgi:hypothetical protein
MIQGPYIQTCKVKTVQLLLELQVAAAFPHNLQSCSCDCQPHAAVTKVPRAILLPLLHCLQMCFRRKVPMDCCTEILHPLDDVEEGLGCNATSVITTRGTNNLTIPSTVFLDVS